MAKSVKAAVKRAPVRIGKSVSVLRWALRMPAGQYVNSLVSRGMPIVFGTRLLARKCKRPSERVVRVRVTVEVIE